MTNYTCQKCNKIFKQKIDYSRHINRKFPCIDNNKVENINEEIINKIHNIPQEIHIITQKVENSPQIFHNMQYNALEKLQCKYCNKIYARTDSLYRHINSNMCKTRKLINQQNENKDKMIELLMKQQNEKNFQINALVGDINKLKDVILKSEFKINTMTNSNNINTNSNNVITNNFIVKFGEENPVNKLTPDEIAKIINKGYCALQESVKLIHFNKRLPEYHNIYVSDRKFKYGLKYTGDKFELTELTVLINDLIDNHRNNIEEYLEMNNIPYKKCMMIKVKDLVENLDDLSNDNFKNKREELVKELRSMLYNGKDIVINTHKKIIGNDKQNETSIEINTQILNGSPSDIIDL